MLASSALASSAAPCAAAREARGPEPSGGEEHAVAIPPASWRRRATFNGALDARLRRPRLNHGRVRGPTAPWVGGGSEGPCRTTTFQNLSNARLVTSS